MGVSANASSRAGLRDWLIQRVSAMIVLAYFIFICVLLFAGHSVAQWRTLFSHAPMKLLTMFTLLSICWHAWIGLWTVLTDYVHNKKTQYSMFVVILAAIFYMIFDLARILWF